VGVRAAAHALVAARAGGEVDEKHALAVDEAGLHGHLHVFGRVRLALDRAPRLEALHRFLPQLVLDVRVGGGDGAEDLARELDDLDVLQGLQGHRPGVLEEQRRLPRVVALAEVGQGQVLRSRVHRHLDVTADDEQERVRGRALLDDDLSGLVRAELGPPLDVLDEGIVHAREERHHAELPGQDSFAVALLDALLELLRGGQEHAQAGQADLEHGQRRPP
jgi:hypothetical protein